MSVVPGAAAGFEHPADATARVGAVVPDAPDPDVAPDPGELLVPVAPDPDAAPDPGASVVPAPDAVALPEPGGAGAADPGPAAVVPLDDEQATATSASATAATMTRIGTANLIWFLVPSVLAITPPRS